MVGERGPEMVVMPPGASVLTNGQTNRRGGGEGRVINVNLGGVTVNNEMDVNQLGYRLASLLEGLASDNWLLWDDKKKRATKARRREGGTKKMTR